ncbi:MAG: formylglycine-generating enzyme family protein [Xanthobacteraceae bacterium]|nr:formylglycine-generating enzyme family protein [Xanthobacteraceae bacterium]
MASLALATSLTLMTAVYAQDDEARYWQTNMAPSILSFEQEAEKASKPGSDFAECANGCPTMLVVPAGRFTMGSPAREADRLPNEGPQHEVTIAKAFAVGRTEVTFAQWDACVAAAACRRVGDSTWGRGERPVINVGWNDAAQYAAWLARMTGKPYRLLSEAEWEYAARAGTTTRFSFGEDDSELGRYAWFFKNSERKSQAVGMKAPNGFGLHDMHGNVYEWVSDPWHEDYENAPRDGSVWSDDPVPNRHVARSGSWFFDAKNLRSASRVGPPSNLQDGNVGFRIARDLQSAQ